MNLKVLRKEYKLPLCILQDAVNYLSMRLWLFRWQPKQWKSWFEKALGELCTPLCAEAPLPSFEDGCLWYGSGKKQVAVVKLVCSSERRMSCIVDIANTLAQEALVNGKDDVLNKNTNLSAASLGERFQIEAVDIFSFEDCIYGLYCHKTALSA